MKVLVLMSTYNGEKYLREQLDSILSQEGNFSVYILIRDDGSTDSTKNIILEYCNIYSNIKFYSGENIGYTASFLELLNIADECDYYSFSDQDDIWLEDKLQIAINSIKNVEKAALYASTSFLTDDSIHVLGTTQKMKKNLSAYNGLIECFMPGHTLLFNHQLLMQLKGNHDTSKIYAHDYWCTMYALTFATVVFDNSPHTYYRQHASNVFGYTNGRIAWIRNRLRRIKGNETRLIALQIHYFYETYYDILDDQVKREIEKLFGSRNLLSRLSYALTSKLYCQSRAKTFMLKALLIAGLYTIEIRD